MWRPGGGGGGGVGVADADVLCCCNSLSSFFPSAPGPPPIRMRKYFVWHLYR